jgi:hypothetical protein
VPARFLPRPAQDRGATGVDLGDHAPSCVLSMRARIFPCRSALFRRLDERRIRSRRLCLRRFGLRLEWLAQRELMERLI